MLLSFESVPELAAALEATYRAELLLRDKRNAAGLSRVQLAHRAKLSEATVKFTETARHPPSRATLIRLIGDSELKFRWADVPGHPMPPSAETSGPLLPAERTGLPSQLNCLITPGSESMFLIADLARFLNSAGGYVEQTHAYLDHYSAADYLRSAKTQSPPRPCAVACRSASWPSGSWPSAIAPRC